MIPAGYMAKRISNRPDWIQAPSVNDIYFVSNCVSDDFADYINYWQHNGYWLFDSPEIIKQIAAEHSINIADTKLFYYEVHELAFHGECEWKTSQPEPSFKTLVIPPTSKHLEGYDIVTFFAGNNPEHSPLSCNGTD